MALVPVDYDPFQNAAPPGGGRLVPVDYDPFSKDAENNNNQKINYTDQGLDNAGGKSLSFLNGSLLNLGDEATASALSGASKLGMTNMPVSYDEALNTARGIQKGFSDAHPIESGGLALGGALASSALGGALSPVAKGATLLKNAPLSGKIALGAGTGTLTAGAYGFGGGEGQDNRLSDAATGAGLGGLLGGAIPAAGPIISGIAKGSKTSLNGMFARGPDELSAARDSFFKDAGGVYDKMREAGAVINGNASNSLMGSINSALSKNKFIPQLNPKTTAIVDHIKDVIAKNGSLGLDELDQYRRLLSRVGGSEDGYSAGSVRTAIDDAVNGLKDTDLSNGTSSAIDLLKKGRSLYSQSAKFDELSSIVQKANGDPNKIKQLLTNFVKNPDNLKGYSKDQIDVIRNAATTGAGENILKAFGKLGFDFSKSGTGNTVLPAILSGTGLYGVLPHGIPLAIGGTVARQGQKYLARGKAEEMLKYLQP